MKIFAITNTRYRDVARRRRQNDWLASFIVLGMAAVALISAAILIVGAITTLLTSRHTPF
jgi:hypothetical protein